MNLSRQNAMQIVTEISGIIHQNINLMDENGIIIASTDPGRIGAFHEGAAQVIAQNLEELAVHDDAEYQGSRKGINLPVRFENEIVGVIGMTGEHDEVAKYGQILKKMTEILLLENYSKEQKKIDDRIRARFLDEWLFEEAPLSNRQLIERGARLGIDITIPRRALVAEIAGLQNDADSADSQRKIDAAYQAVRRLTEREAGSVFAKTASQMLCLIPACDDRKLLSDAQELQKQVLETCGLPLLIGIDAPALTVRQSCRKARKALRACVNASESSIRFYDDIRLEIVTDEISPAAKQEFLERMFRGLQREEVAYWVRLLQVYFLTNGSVGKTADQLHMHKNTLQYKLRRLHERTGYDPRRLSDAALFYLALQFCEQENGFYDGA